MNPMSAVILIGNAPQAVQSNQARCPSAITLSSRTSGPCLRYKNGCRPKNPHATLKQSSVRFRNRAILSSRVGGKTRPHVNLCYASLTRRVGSPCGSHSLSLMFMLSGVFTAIFSFGRQAREGLSRKPPPLSMPTYLTRLSSVRYPSYYRTYSCRESGRNVRTGYHLLGKKPHLLIRRNTVHARRLVAAKDLLYGRIKLYRSHLVD